MVDELLICCLGFIKLELTTDRVVKMEGVINGMFDEYRIINPTSIIPVGGTIYAEVDNGSKTINFGPYKKQFETWNKARIKRNWEWRRTFKKW